MKKKTGFMHDYGLSITLGGMFLASWAGQAVFQWLEFAHDQQTHGELATLAGFIAPFLSATFENWQSEFMQVLTFVVITASLYHKGSHESKDNDEEMDAAMLRVERRLEFLGAEIAKLGGADEHAEYAELQTKVNATRKSNRAA